MWVWVGWLFPILSLWYPKQVVDDVWRGTVQNPSQPNTGWWWGTWVATQLLGGIADLWASSVNGEPHGSILEHLAWLEDLVWLELLTALAITIALPWWIRVVRTISAAQDALAGVVLSSQ